MLSNGPSSKRINGGGFVMGTAATARGGLQELVLAHDCVAISVDYCLAPKTPYSGALEDNYAALRWMHTHADQLGIHAFDEVAPNTALTKVFQQAWNRALQQAFQQT